MLVAADQGNRKLPILPLPISSPGLMLLLYAIATLDPQSAMIGGLLFFGFGYQLILPRIRFRQLAVAWWTALLAAGFAGYYASGINLLTLVTLLVGTVGMFDTLHAILLEKSSSSGT